MLVCADRLLGELPGVLLGIAQQLTLLLALYVIDIEDAELFLVGIRLPKGLKLVVVGAAVFLVAVYRVGCLVCGRLGCLPCWLLIVWLNRLRLLRLPLMSFALASVIRRIGSLALVAARRQVTAPAGLQLCATRAAHDIGIFQVILDFFVVHCFVERSRVVACGHACHVREVVLKPLIEWAPVLDAALLDHLLVVQRSLRLQLRLRQLVPVGRGRAVPSIDLRCISNSLVLLVRRVVDADGSLLLRNTIPLLAFVHLDRIELI